MRVLLLTCVCVFVFSAPALACRGLWEYPETISKVGQLDMTSVKKAAYKKRLDDGFALHELGRASKNRSQMTEAVKLLDQIKLELGN